MLCEVIIPGPPTPQKQTRFANGRAYDPSSKDKERIRKYMWLHGISQPFEEAVQVIIRLFFEIPKSYSKAKRDLLIAEGTFHTKKPDADNCSYIITNAMKGIWIMDDSQIVDLFISKRYTLESARTIVQLCAA